MTTVSAEAAEGTAKARVEIAASASKTFFMRLLLSSNERRFELKLFDHLDHFPGRGLNQHDVAVRIDITVPIEMRAPVTRNSLQLYVFGNSCSHNDAFMGTNRRYVMLRHIGFNARATFGLDGHGCGWCRP